MIYKNEQNKLDRSENLVVVTFGFVKDLKKCKASFGTRRKKLSVVQKGIVSSKLEIGIFIEKS